MIPYPSRSRSTATLLLVGLACCVGAADAAAQRVCEIVDPTENVRGITLAGGGQILYVARPHMRCQDGVYISADSAVIYTAQNMSHLLGDVRFLEGTQELTADEARYFTQQGRLSAEGNLFVRDSVRGTEIENGDLVYLRRTDFRDREQMTIVAGARDRVRPRARLYMRQAPPVDEAVADSATVADSLAAADRLMAPDSVMVPHNPLALDPLGVMDTLLAPDSVMVPDNPLALDPLGVMNPLPVADSVVAPDSALAADSVVVPDSVLVADSVAVPDSAVAVDSLVAADTSAAPDTLPLPRDTIPYIVEADRLELEGDDYFRAKGRVEIVRDSMHAFADSAEYDEEAGHLNLMSSARVEASTYELEGETILLGLATAGGTRTVRALRQALLTGDDLELVSPVIQIYLKDGGLERLVAVPMGPNDTVAGVAADSADLARPVAQAQDFELTADSLDVLAPEGILDRILASGAARGVSQARDSLNVEVLPEIAAHDWMEGDTVIATFRLLEQAPEVADTAGNQYSLDQLVASGSARSLYRLEPSDTSSTVGVDPPAVHYVRGARITIVLEGGEVDRMEVEGPTEGVHLEPFPVQVATDSTAPPDTTAQPDSSGVGGVERAGRDGHRGPDGGTPPRHGGTNSDKVLPQRTDHGRVHDNGRRR